MAAQDMKILKVLGNGDCISGTWQFACVNLCFRVN